MAAENEVRQRAEPEHVQQVPRCVGVRGKLGCLVEPGRFVGELIQVLGATQQGRLRRAGARPATGLPVGDDQPWARLVRVADQDGARIQTAVDQMTGVRVPHDLGEVADQVEAFLHGQPVTALRQPVIEAHRVRIVLEDHRWPELVVDQVGGVRNAWMMDALQQPELPLGGALDGVPVVWARLRREVEADPAHDTRVELVPSQVVLPPLPLRVRLRVQQQLQHGPVGDRGPDAGPVDQAHNLSTPSTVDQVALVGRLLGQQSQDARQTGVAVGLQAVHPLPPDLVEARPHGWCVQEDRGADERYLDPLAGLLAIMLEQAGQPLGLPVGQDQRVVGPAGAPVRRPHHPLVAVTADRTLPVLELQQVQSARGQDQQVNLVYRAIGRHEFDIRPGEVRIGVEQERLDVPKTGPLVLPGAGIDLFPARRVVTDLAHLPDSLSERGNADRRQGETQPHRMVRVRLSIVATLRHPHPGGVVVLSCQIGCRPIAVLGQRIPCDLPLLFRSALDALRRCGVRVGPLEDSPSRRSGPRSTHVFNRIVEGNSSDRVEPIAEIPRRLEVGP